MNRALGAVPPYAGGQETVASAVRPPRARASRSTAAAFDLSRELRNVEVRRQLVRAGYVSGVTIVACEADTPISDVMRWVDNVTEVDEVLVVVRAGDGWDMWKVPKPTRTEALR